MNAQSSISWQRIICFAFFTATIFALAGCGSNTPLNNEGPANVSPNTSAQAPPGGCAINLSGAVTATLPCQANGSYDAGGNITRFILTPTGMSGGVLLGSVAFQVQGAATTGTYTAANAVAFAAQLSQGAGMTNQAWIVTKQPPMGQMSLTVSSVSNSVTGGPGNTSFSMHGTLLATLVPSQGSGTVNLQAVF
jgi:hypothetical protein